MGQPEGPRGASGRSTRCIALVGPFLSGKTTLLDAILARTGKIPRQGKTTDGSTVGDASATPFGLLTAEQWNNAVSVVKDAAGLCLAIAMAAVGLSTSLSSLKSVGLKPLGLGLAAAAVVGVISSTLINLLY